MYIFAKVNEKYNMNLLTFGTVAVLTVVAMLSAALVIVPIEDANAATSPNFSYKQTHESRCIEGAKCSYTGTVTFENSPTTTAAPQSPAGVGSFPVGPINDLGRTLGAVFGGIQPDIDR
jgi:hypothetical protein